MTTESTLLHYDLGPGAEAFSTRRDSILPFPVIQGHQVHGFRVGLVDRPDMTKEELSGYDALVTALPGVAVGVHTADCVPILLYNPQRRVVAAIHSGWKGTVQRISQKVLFVLKSEFGGRPEEVRAVIGPAIGPDSFQVGEEVVFEDMIHYTTVKTTMFNGISHPSLAMRHCDGSLEMLREYNYEDYRDRMD